MGDSISAGHFIPNREGYPKSLSKDPVEQSQESNEQAQQATELPEKTQKAAIETAPPHGAGQQKTSQDKDSGSSRPSNIEGRGRKVDIDT